MARHSIGVAKAVLGWTPAYLTFTDVLFSTAAIDGRYLFTNSGAARGSTLLLPLQES